MAQPTSFVKDGNSKLAYKIKSLYGFKQATRAWHEKVDTLFLSSSFSGFHLDPRLYVNHVNGKILLLYFM